MTEELRRRFLARDGSVLDEKIGGTTILDNILIRPRCARCASEGIVTGLETWRSLQNLTGECFNCNKQSPIETAFYDKEQKLIAIYKPYTTTVQLFDTLFVVGNHDAPQPVETKGVSLCPHTSTTDCACRSIPIGDKIVRQKSSTSLAPFDNKSLHNCAGCVPPQRVDPMPKQSLHQNIMDGNLAAIAQQTNRSDIEKDVNCGMTGLYFASLKGKVDVVKFYLQNGANVNAKSKRGSAPLHCAVISDCPEVVRILLTAGANVNETDATDSTPLHFAGSSEEICTMLLKAGANIHAETRSKETPLNLAARSGRYGIAEQLLNAKAIVDTTNSFGRTPLATAFYFGRQLVAQLLLANGARLSNVKPDIPIPSWAGGEVVRGIEEKNLVIKSLEASTRLLSERLESADGTITTLTRKVLDLSTQVEFQLQRANESEQRLQEVTTAFSALKAMLDQMRAEREPKHFMDQ